MNKALPYILCWCLCASLSAQTSVIDSLEQVLASCKLKNPEKAELLKNIATQYVYYDTAKCRKYALEAIRLAQETGSKKTEAAGNIVLANSYILADSAKHRLYALKALRLVQNNKGSEMDEGIAHITLGAYYFYANQYYLSYVHYKKAEKLLLPINDKKRLSVVYISLMALFTMIDDENNKMYYADKLLEISVEQGDLEMELRINYDIGWASSQEKSTQEALDFNLDLYHKSLSLNSKYTNEIALACGEMYLLLNQPREALKLIRRVHESIEAGHQGVFLSSVYSLYTKAYVQLNQVDSAEYCIGKALNLPIFQERIRQELYYTRSQLDAIKGDYRSALANFKIYHHRSDSVAKAGKTTEMAQMKNWYELEQKDNKNQLLQQEGQKQHKLILILAGALGMIFALLALSVFLYRKTARKNSELKKLHTVKDKLFSVVAHDLRSPISALMSMLKLVGNDMIDAETQTRLLSDISSRVDDTYGLLDNLLHWSKSQMQGIVPSPAYFDVQEGSRAVTDSLQSIAASKMIALNNHIEKQQVYADRDMFAVVVRNLTMNAIKYTSAEGEITLASELIDDMLVISVKDTGTGIPQEVQDKLFKLSETKSQRGTNNESGTGLGLVLCADFVKINGGSIWFHSKQGEGSKFCFSIPIKGR